LHRERRQLERGDPALGASLQRGHVPRGQLQAHHPVEVRRGLIRGEAQLGRADLDQLAARPQSRQRQRGIGAAGDHHVQPRRQMVEQERHRVLHITRVDDVVVVKHQHDVCRDGTQGLAPDHLLCERISQSTLASSPHLFFAGHDG